MLGADVDRYLLRSEQKVFAVRRHWASLAGSAATLIGFWLIGIAGVALFDSVYVLRVTFLVFPFLSCLWFAWLAADWYVERFVVTNRRVLLVSGLLTRRVAIMPLVKVTDLTYEQSLVGRSLRYGSFVIESAGAHQALSRIDYLPQPDKHYQQVSRLLFGTGIDYDEEDLPANQTTEPVPHVSREPRP